MDRKEPLQFDVTLKRLSMTTLLIQIYEHPDMKEKLKGLIHVKDRGHPYAFPSTLIKKELIKSASKEIKKLELPENLTMEMQGISIFFANKISIWSDYVIRMLELDISYLDKIYFTIYGCVDEGKIFDSYWQTHKTFSKILKTIRRESSSAFTIRMACQFANKEIILALQHSIIKAVQKHLGRVKLPDIKNKIDQLIGYYVCYVYGEVFDMEQGKDFYRKFKLTGNINIAEVIFMAEGNPEAIKILWDFLSDAEKKNNVLPLAQLNLFGGLECGRMSFALDDNSINQIEMIEVSKCSEAVIFLINQMTSKQRKLFLTQNICGLMELFLMVWPYPEICKKILDEPWICEEILQKNKGGVILRLLLFRMLKDLADAKCVFGSYHYPDVFYEILKKLLSLVTKEVKEKLFLQTSYGSLNGRGSTNAIHDFFDVFDLNALSIVINDDDLKHKRDIMIKMGLKKISELIKLGKVEESIKFMGKVLISNEDRIKFLEVLDPGITNAIAEDGQNLCEKILDSCMNRLKL